MGAMIVTEIGDFSRFDSPDQILAYAGLSPTTYQSIRLVDIFLCPHGEAWFTTLALCTCSMLLSMLVSGIQLPRLIRPGSEPKASITMLRFLMLARSLYG